MLKFIFTNLFALCFLGLAQTSQAATLQILSVPSPASGSYTNPGQDVQSYSANPGASGVRTMFFPMAGCAGANLYQPPGQTPQSRFLTTADMLYFTITADNSPPPATIDPNNDTGPVIRAELVSSNGVTITSTYLDLIPYGGSSYYTNGGANDPTQIVYSQTLSPVSFGVVLTDPGNLPGLTSGYPNGTRGFCDVTAGGGGSDCTNITSGQAVNSYVMQIGIVAPGGAFEMNSNVDLVSPQVSFMLAACPPGTGTNFPTLSLSLTPQQSALDINFNSYPPTDNTGVLVQNVAVFADLATTTQNPTATAVNQQTFSQFGNGTQVTMTNLMNGVLYCLSAAYVNFANIMSFLPNPGVGVATGSPPWNCAEPSVVDGNLSGNAGCFIATAAYNYSWDPRLETLRQFRDLILDHFALGRAFAHWYYSWSPAAARWIIAHPFMQPPVKALLFPLYELAAFTLWARDNLVLSAVLMLLLAATSILIYTRKHEAH